MAEQVHKKGWLLRKIGDEWKRQFVVQELLKMYFYNEENDTVSGSTLEPRCCTLAYTRTTLCISSFKPTLAINQSPPINHVIHTF
jgi:hypothetical protein